MEVKQQEGTNTMSMSIVPHIPAESATLIVGESGDGSPLRAVAPHAAKAAIEHAFAIVGFDALTDAVIFEAEGWLVSKYVGPDFCGLCARNVCHQGEH